MTRIAATRLIPHSNHLTVHQLTKDMVGRATLPNSMPRVSTVSLEPQEPRVAQRAIAVLDPPCSEVLAAPLLDTNWEEVFLVPWAVWSLEL